eukprot:g1609.t1
MIRTQIQTTGIYRKEHCCIRTTYPNRPFSDVVRARATRHLFTNKPSWTREENRCSRKEGSVLRAAISTSPASLDENREDLENEKFSWFKNWWAVQIVRNLETDRPNKIKLLNKDFIVWKGHSGNWIAMDDECPHRMAPLSEGRIEKDGNLLCSYHAWRFNESGKCVKIPHAEDEKAHSVACNSSRSSVQTYPCRTRGSLLWIWPDNSVSAFADSSQEPLPMDEDLMDYLEIDISERITSPYMRIIPCSYDTLVENIADPSHFPVAHHGVQPFFSRYNLSAMDMKQLDRKNAKSLEEVSFNMKQIHSTGRIKIRAPGHIVYYMLGEGEKPISRSYFCVAPIDQGRSLLITEQAPEDMILNMKRASFFEKPFYAITRLLFHLQILHRVIDTDAMILNEQDKKTKRSGYQFSAKKNYFVPTDADTLVMKFRKWFESTGQCGAVFGGDKAMGIETELTKEQVLDRYEQHTKHCKTCMQALNIIRTALFVSKVLFVLSSIALCVLVWKYPSAGAMKFTSFLKNVQLVTSALASLLFFFLANVLEKKIIPLFYFVDYSHADAN